MRFFTNENKDDRDDARDVDVQDRDDHPEAVQSDPVAVPQQRSNSPWSSTPENEGAHNGTDDDTVTDETARDDTVVDDDTVRDDKVRDDTVLDDTVRDDTLRDDTVVDDDTDDVVHDEATGIHRRDDEDAIGDDDAGTNRVDEALDDRGDFDDPKVSGATDLHEDTTPPDHAVSDTTLEPTTTTYGPDGVVTTDDTTDSEVTSPVVPVASDSPDFVDETRDDDSDVDDAAVAAVPVAAAASTNDSKPGEVAAPDVTRLFGDDSQGFKDRWRDVQLRFVDSPKEATAEAATLVDEAVDRLTASLKAQKNQFGGESTEDTEKLRVELRGYRDILNRIIDL